MAETVRLRSSIFSGCETLSICSLSPHKRYKIVPSSMQKITKFKVWAPRKYLLSLLGAQYKGENGFGFFSCVLRQKQ